MTDFLTALDGLEAAGGISEIYSSARIESTLLRKCIIRKSEGGQFPDISSAISFFRNAFDAALAKRDGVIRPKQGVDKGFDDAKVINSSQDRNITFVSQFCIFWIVALHAGRCNLTNFIQPL